MSPVDSSGPPEHPVGPTGGDQPDDEAGGAAMTTHAVELHLPVPGEDASSARNLLVVLGLPTFGLAFAISILTTYGPVVLLARAGSPTAVGALIGGEGAFALVIPLIAGALSDRLPRAGLARRVPFLAAGTPLAAAGVVLLPFGHSFLLAGTMVFLFYVGYYLYYPPYRAMYADLLPRSLFARSQSGQAIARGAGLGAALLVGGVLLGVWAPLPFVLAGGLLVATTLALLPIIHLERDAPHHAAVGTPIGIRMLFHDPGLRTFAVANALWEFSFAGLKSFIVLFVVRGLGHSTSVASGVIAVVAVAYVAGAPLAAWLAERYGMVPVMSGSAIVFGLGLTAGLAFTSLAPDLVLLPFVAIAGATLLTLPQALAFTLAPSGGEGAAAGIVDFSRGIGVVLGPVLVGVAVGLSDGWLHATHGYAAMWPVIGIPVLLSVPLLRSLQRRMPVLGQGVQARVLAE